MVRINEKEINHNEYLTGSEKEYLDKRFDALENELEKKYPYQIRIEKSRQSEARYITIMSDEDTLPDGVYATERSITVRNHDFFVPESGNNDHFIFLSNFETWTKLKNHLLNKLIPQLIEEVKDGK